MNNILRAKIFFLVFLFLILAGVNAHAQQTDQKFEGFNLQGYTETGDKSWDVNSKTANVDGTKVILSNVNANSYGEQKVNVTAEKGTLDQSSGNMKLEKDVVVTSDQGSQLLTDTLNWDRNQDLVTTKDEVFIKDERFTASGKGMEAKPGLKNAKIMENVTVRVNANETPKNNKLVTITSDGPMIIDQATSIATFYDNVKAVQADQTLRADRMEIYFLEKMEGVDRIICIGNVEIDRGDNKTYADKATYVAAEKRMILSGKPKLILKTEGKDGFAAFGN